MPEAERLTEILAGDEIVLQKLNQELENLTAQQRVDWGLHHLPQGQVLSSSFGIQSAVMLHLMTSAKPDIPVIVVDTGYLFAETYRFIEEINDRLDLNMHVYRSHLSPAWQEARYGRLWEQGLEGLNRYNRINKVDPMQQAFTELSVASWYTGIRRQQSSTRQHHSVLRLQDGRFKMHPIVDWSNRDVHRYLIKNQLPYHPLWEKGYSSVGDYHSSMPLSSTINEEQSRFFGLKRECGLHE